jgi:imidazolonepropionase-like amidohydrolase
MLPMNAQEMGDILIKNGTLITITQGVKEGSDILIQNGKISSIGKNIKAPKGIKSVDASGKFVMPGIIDAHSHIAISAVNESTNPVTAEVWVGDALDPLDISIYRALAGGVTISHAMHGSANVIGGQCETIKHRWGTYDPEVLRMKNAPRTIKFALGENPMRVHGEGRNISPSTRMGVEQVFRKAFSEAKAYRADWDAYNKDKSTNKVPPVYNLRNETLADILAGDIIIHCHSYRADEILMLMNVCKDFGINKLCYQHVNEGFKVAPELAAFGAQASVFADWWAYKFEVYYSTAYNAAILTKNGVITSINSDSGELIRHLFHEAGKTQKYGKLTDNEALRLITINPAIQLGIDDRVGSLEKGKDGDVVIFENHPLSVYAKPQMTIVDGVVRFNIQEDAQDMRIDIDPNEDIPAYYEMDTEYFDRCMQDVFDYFENEK